MDRIISVSKYSRSQHKAFYKFHVIHRSGSLKFLLLMALLMLLIALSSTFNKDLSLKTNMNQMIMGWVIFAFTLLITPLMIIFKVNSVVRQETQEILQSKEKIEVTKIKFTRTNDSVEGKYVFGWRDIDTLCETDKYFYIYLADNNGIFIVKDDIIEGDVALFRKLALNNLKQNKRGKVPYKRYGKVRKEYLKERKKEKRALKLQARAKR